METTPTQKENNLFKKKLVWQLGVPFTLFLSTIIIAVGVFIVYTYNTSRNEAASVPVRQVLALEEELERVLVEVEKYSRLVIGSVGKEFERTSFIQDIVIASPAIFEMTFYDVEGKEMLRVTKPTVGIVTEKVESVRTSSFFENALKGKDFFDAPFISKQGALFVFWSFPVKDPAGNVIGVMRSTVDLSATWEVISRNNIGEAYIVDERGTLLISKQLEETKQQLSLRDFPTVRDFISKKEGIQTYEGLRGDDVLGTWKPLSPTKWAVVVEIPVSYIYQDVYRLLGIFATLLVVAIILMAYELINLNRKVFEPLTAFKDASIKRGNGDLDARVIVSVGNEFDDVADTYNQTADKIKELYENLEKKVEERTASLNEKLAEIKKLNSFMVDREIKMVELKKKIKELGGTTE